MITANLAGSTGSHLRTDRGHSHSRQDLNEILENEAGLHACQYVNGADDPRTEEEKRADAEANAKRLQQIVDEYKRRKCLKDYKTWGYLACVGVVVVAAIILIVLAASGFLNLDPDS